MKTLRSFKSEDQKDSGGEGFSCVAIGNFDGVHLGHQELLKKAVEHAQQNSLQSTCVTFEPLPAVHFKRTKGPENITLLPEKISYLEALGLDQMCVQRFDHDFSQLSPEKFVKNFLLDYLNARAVFVGENFCFGLNRSGDAATLVELCRKWGIVPNIIAIKAAADRQRISSTYIRELLRQGEMERVAKFLGRSYTYSAKIVSGYQVGRKIGVPTLNLQIKPQILPKHGVYAGLVRWLGDCGQSQIARAVISLGTRPTFTSEGQVSLEAHLLNVDESEKLPSVPERVTLVWGAFLRENRQFSDSEQLVAQIKKDIQITLQVSMDETNLT